jgi:predicted CoA-binding protein
MLMRMSQTVAVLGASDNPTRYAYLAFRKLREHGHRPIPVSPKLRELEGVPAVAQLGDIREKVDTLTMYVGPERSSKMAHEILALKPGRVIFNPGSENPALESELAKAGIPFEHACTLVLLSTDQFE